MTETVVGNFPRRETPATLIALATPTGEGFAFTGLESFAFTMVTLRTIHNRIPDGSGREEHPIMY